MKPSILNRLALTVCPTAAVVIFASPALHAANQYFDFDVANNLTPGAATWDAGGTAAWANSTTPGTAAPVAWVDGNSAFFQTAGANTVTLSGTVIANAVTQTTNGTATTISGGTALQIGPGGLANTGNTAFIINSNINLDSSQTWNVATAVTAAGVVGEAVAGTGITKTGGAILTLSSSNTFTGGFVANGGVVTNNLSGTGTPFGTGSITLNGNGSPTNFGTGAVGLSIIPAAVDASTLTGGTAVGSQFAFSSTAYVNLVRKDSGSPLDFTFGPGSGPVLNRLGRGVLVFMDNASNQPAAMGFAGGNNFIVNGTAPAETNGMVPAFYLGGRNGGTGQATFMTYDGTYGFTPVIFDVANSLTGWDATKKVTIDAKTVAENLAAYALRVTGTLTMDPGITVSLGDNGTTPAGLILQGGTGISGGTLAFGASEAVVYLAGNYAVSSAISGSNGLTKTQYAGTNGALSLSGTNSYTGVTTVNTGVLNVGAGGTSGDLGGSTHVALGPGAILGFNRSDTSSWSGNVTGLGTVQKSGTGNFTLSLNGNQTFGTVQTANTAGLMTLTTAAPSDTVNATLRGVQGGNMAIISGNWITPNLGINSTGAQMRSKLTISNATVTAVNGRYTAGSLDIQSGGTLAVQTDRFTFANEQVGTTTLFTLDIGTGAMLDVYSTSFVSTIGGGTATGSAIYSALVRQSAGTAKFGVTNGTSTANRNLAIGGAGVNAKSAYDLSGGTLLVRGTLYAGAAAGTGGINNLNFRGGVLAAANITTANLGSTDSTTDPVANSLSIGTLVNRGGTLAPGNVGTTGLTSINGDYAVASGSLAIDIGGTTASTAFQDAAASGKHDRITVTGTGNVSLAGTLSVRIVDGFPVDNSDTFTILSAPAVSGSFSNLSGGRIAAGGGGSFAVTIDPTSVVLSDYQAGASGSYLSWIGGYNVGGQSEPNDDFDNDGLDNAVEHVLGSDPSVYNTGLNQISATSATLKFRHPQTNALATDVVKSYQWSTDLIEWKASGQSNTGGTAVTIAETTITDNIAPANDVIEVTLTVTGTSAAKVFGRLLATKAP